MAITPLKELEIDGTIINPIEEKSPPIPNEMFRFRQYNE
ncbi:unnamed protein product [Arabidopsis halleri]